MRIAVIDGQGGGIGKAVVDKLKKEFGESIEIVALGTNSLATSMMLKAGANEGATGENAIVYNCDRVDIIIGSVNIVCANSFLGELTAVMADAVSKSRAKKILIPLNKYEIYICGNINKPLPHYVDDAVEMVKVFGGVQNV